MNKRVITVRASSQARTGANWRLAFVDLVTLMMLNLGSTHAQNERATVRLDGRAVFRVSAVGDIDATARARQIERRMNRLLQNPSALALLRIESADANDSDRVISMAGVPVVTVTQTDAQENLTTVDALATQWSQAVDVALQRGSKRRLSSLARFATEVQASIETAFARLIESAIMLIPRALAALLVISLFWAIATGVRWLMRIIFCRLVGDLTVENLIKQVAYYIVWVLGIIVAIDAFGLDPQTVVTGLGLTSLALGFALKDIISNFISGILILTLRPFRLGDQIIIGETEGNVERIELRATQLRTYDGRVVLVPNAEVFTSRIINNTAAPIRRGSAALFIGYDSDLQKAVTVVHNAVQTAVGVLEEPAVARTRIGTG